MMRRALVTEALVSKENRASTSVETLPGTIARISRPNSTRRRSRAWSTCWSRSPPCSLPQAIEESMSLAYSGFLAAARIREGLVVASWGLYLAMAARWVSVSLWFRGRFGLFALQLLLRKAGPQSKRRGGCTNKRSHLVREEYVSFSSPCQSAEDRRRGVREFTRVRDDDL